MPYLQTLYNANSPKCMLCICNPFKRGTNALNKEFGQKGCEKQAASLARARVYIFFHLRLDQKAQFIKGHKTYQPGWINAKLETCNLHFQLVLKYPFRGLIWSTTSFAYTFNENDKRKLYVLSSWNQVESLNMKLTGM